MTTTSDRQIDRRRFVSGAANSGLALAKLGGFSGQLSAAQATELRLLFPGGTWKDWFDQTFVDGAVIAAAVITSLPLGLTTALAVATHEIPQEVGDVAILLRAGYTRLRAFTLNILAGAGGILGAIVMVLASRAVPAALPYVLAFAAGNFLYVAMVDLIPDLHRGSHATVSGWRQLLLISAGIGTIALL